MEQQCNSVHRVLCSGWVWRKEGYQVSHVLAAAVAAIRWAAGWIDVRYICNLVSIALNRDALQFQSSLLAFSLACSLLTDEQHSCTLMRTLLWSRVSVPRVSLAGLSIGITLHQSVVCIFSRTCQLPSVTGSSTSLHLHWGSHFSLFSPKKISTSLPRVLMSKWRLALLSWSNPNLWSLHKIT